MLLALLVEALLVLLVLTLGSSLGQNGKAPPTADVVRFKSVSEREQAQDEPKKAEPADAPQPRPVPRAPEAKPEPVPVPTPVTQAKPKAEVPPMIRLSSKEMSAANIASPPSKPAPPAPNRAQMGPVDSGTAYGDTPRVSGSGPNGEPLYAASWYREPTHDELSGYLSTATGPGWGLIACRTAPGFRVEDCVKVDEYPQGSNIARSVLAAAWQFRVRPPRIGGEPKIGEWVRIRIDYVLTAR